jgi:hypothetical protein
VKQLGSDRFEEREEASRRLEEIGGAALPALEKAAGSEDAEIRGRAARLATLVQSRIEAREARRVIERGVQALGGEERLSRYKGLKIKGKSSGDMLGRPVSYTIELIERLPSQCRITQREGQKLKTFVLDGDRGWSQEGQGPALPLDENLAARLRESLHERVVTTLSPLLRGEF